MKVRNFKLGLVVAGLTLVSLPALAQDPKTGGGAAGGGGCPVTAGVICGGCAGGGCGGCCLST